MPRVSCLPKDGQTVLDGLRRNLPRDAAVRPGGEADRDGEDASPYLQKFASLRIVADCGLSESFTVGYIT